MKHKSRELGPAMMGRSTKREQPNAKGARSKKLKYATIGEDWGAKNFGEKTTISKEEQELVTPPSKSPPPKSSQISNAPLPQNSQISSSQTQVSTPRYPDYNSHSVERFSQGFPPVQVAWLRIIRVRSRLGVGQ